MSLISLTMMPQADARFNLPSLPKEASANPLGCFGSQEIFSLRHSSIRIQFIQGRVD